MKKRKLKALLNESERMRGIANRTVHEQSMYIEKQNKEFDNLTAGYKAQKAFIETLEKHEKIMNLAIERKDKQFLGLRSAYQDEIINKG